MYCPRESVHVDDLELSILKKHRCSVFDDIVICQHDLREMFQGGHCIVAGNTYVCEDEIPHLLDEKCLDFSYEG